MLVATVRALKHHAGLEDDPRVDAKEGLAAVEKGAANLRRHLGIVKTFGLPCVVAVNRRPGDTDEEVALVKKLALDAGAFGAEENDGFSQGGAGAADLAEAVADACEQPNEFQFSYDDDDSIEDKIRKVATKVYGAKDVIFYLDAQKKIRQYNDDGLDKLPICMAKTHLSLSCRPSAAERADGLRVPGARHPGVHRSRLAGAAGRRHPADARPGQDARRAERGYRRGRSHGRALLSVGSVRACRPAPDQSRHWST